MQVAVCICTFRRAKGLERALRALDGLTFEGTAPTVRVVVVDNDAAGSARSVVEAAQKVSRWPLQYRIEPRQGIPFARNACVRESGEADFVAFIDDDETPGAEWLAALVKVIECHHADVVTGPVESELPESVPTWIQHGGFFRPRRLATGTRVDVAYTNNVLVRKAAIADMPRWFDERMSFSGGSDSHFFRRLHAAGRKIVWCAEAVVVEHVPATRATVRWLLARSFRVGSGMTFIRMDAGPVLPAVVVTLAAVLRALAVGVALCAAGLFAGMHVRVKGARWLAYAAGLVVGLGGLRYEEYRRIHGE